MVPREVSFSIPFGLGGADTVFAGQCALKLEGHVEHFVHGFLHPLEFFLVAPVAQEGGVQVAVPGMTEGAHFQPVFCRDFIDCLHHGRNL